ncbi:hypothetical protein [Acetobacter orleanensis]|uniref:Uncharacterized protein n=1 Tax=Acetobacter orleanensis TaxID=104099 RepID=A0A4Y3TS28_9PROT|nr:hypothetical protein [Acetobacter orleanensis]KXV66426.1 hypothetical protein AD949_02660 [Acetobacter orleanensis]PCD78787.1 hypothetical protein CO710_10335 [Acetobacter orleanensis]GAN67913.1 hypothetical protein Abol_013_003 [Acetobacter orleanensis JCM 7639]GEB83810.1 hypothetical protein AOR01nite_22870 [Acetobacter orleanensis]
MTSSARFALAALALSCATALSAPAAHALSAKECHANFAAARKAGTLNGQSYKQFKSAQCEAATAAPAATTAPAPAEAPKEAAAPATPATAPTAAATPAPAAPAAPAAATTAGVVFPSAVAPQYAKLSAGKARMKTCLDQYNTNKSGTGNGNLKWIQKGGGYYSQCNTHLKAG